MIEKADIDSKAEFLRASVIDIADRAGRAILKIYHSTEIKAETKEDNSPVTEADMASHQIICEELVKLNGIPVFSEEDPVKYEIRKNWDMFWLVDPLDGTKNFLARDDQFTVNIALIAGTDPILGVVHVPAQGVAYSAIKGRGAWKRNASGEDSKIYNSSSRTEGEIICAVSSFHDNAASQEFCKFYGITNKRQLGSSLKLCKLAEGEIDVYPRLNGTKEWDTAASQCIIEEAGCKIIDVSTGAKPVYNKEDYRNNFFIASRSDLDFRWPLD